MRSSPTDDQPEREAVEGALREGITRLGLTIADDRVAKLAALALLVARWSTRMNLTGHRGPVAIAQGLVLDAIALHDVIFRLANLPASRSSIVDLGSGAGFPGLPFAILSPELRVTLIDARQKRVHFQREARRRLELRNVEPRLGRIESLEPAPNDIALAQALAQPDPALRYAIPWTRSGGLVVIPGAAQAPSPRACVEIQRVGSERYADALGGPARTLWWGVVA